MQNVPASVKVKQVIGFACGSLDFNRSRRVVQHASALTISKVLADKQGSGSIPCYVQDPEYSSTDEAVMSEFGIEILDNPDGFLAVDDASVIICVTPNVPVKQIICDLARPAAMIWDKVDFDDRDDSL
jgi:hypothetical protein